MKKILPVLSLALLISFLFLLSTCKKEHEHPTISSLSPDTGKEGDAVTIQGTFLAGVTKISFGSTQALVIDAQGSQVTTQVPAGLAIGKTSVKVETSGGSSNPFDFIVIPQVPVLDSISPAEGASGMAVSLYGKYLSTITQASFGAAVVTTFDAKTDTKIDLKVPAGLDLGALNIQATTSGGISNTTSFTVVGAPTITDFVPKAGPAGTVVAITGTNLDETSQIFFQDVKASVFTIQSATLVNVTVPANAASGKIKVVTPGGSILTTFDYVVKGAPTVSLIAPLSGVVGSTVTISGLNLSAPGLKVKFGGVQALVATAASDTQIAATVPAGAASGALTIITNAGSVTTTQTFTVIGAPTISNFTPVNGVIGTIVTINGANFINVQSVSFHDMNVPATDFTVVSNTKITAKVPLNTTDGTIKVTTAGGTVFSTSGFDVIGAPAISSFSPLTGPVGTPVVINGSGFTGATIVKFNGVAAPGYAVTNDTKITVNVPSTATTGSITITTPGGTATSSASFNVILVPFISSISPTAGLAGVTTLTITGTSLSNTTKVKFNSTEVTSLTSNTATQITVLVPASLSPGAVNVSAVTVAGTSNTKTFTVNTPVPKAVISALEPTTSYKGFPVMIKGSNLKSATAVKIGTTAATIVTQYDQTIVFTIPASMANGSYNLTVSNAGGDSAPTTFIVTTAPAGVGAPPAASFLSPPPANFVNVVSNDWGPFLLSTGGGDANCPIIDLNSSHPPLCGKFVFTKDGSGNVTENYIELAIGDPGNVETFYGQWSSTEVSPCFQKLVLISSKDGHLLMPTVQVNFGGACPN